MSAKLADHVLVLSQVIEHRLDPGGEEREITDQAGAVVGTYRGPGEPVHAVGAADYRGGGAFGAVAFTCSCGAELTTDAADVTNAWAEHVAKETSLKPSDVVDHAVEAIRGDDAGNTYVICACGTAVVAEAGVGEKGEVSPADPAVALKQWADHVREQAKEVTR